jgi:hypothetical protein
MSEVKLWCECAEGTRMFGISEKNIKNVVWILTTRKYRAVPLR